MSTESTGTGRLRASDTEREEYARRVRDAVGEGRLTLDEGDERLAAIYAARFRDELHPAVDDLPRPQPPAPRHPYRSGPRFLGGFAAFWLVLVAIWALTPSHFFWPAIPLIFFSIGVLRYLRWVAWRRSWSSR